MSWRNRWAYCLQVLVLVAAGWLLLIVFRVRQPRARLRWCRLLLVACLLLPVLQPWPSPVVVVSEPFAPAQDGAAASAAVEPAVGSGLPLASMLGWILLAGASARALWLLLGLWRLREYRAGATPLYPLPAAMEAARLRTGGQAAVCVSNAVRGPVTFGVFDPIILLPRSILEQSAETQFAIACHEFLHVRRRDWLFALGEEFAGAIMWFHPAIWWLLGQVRLAREQVVDREVVSLTQARDRYVEALLAVAGAWPQLDLAPAPLFLRRRHLSERVRSILKEVSMSRRRVVSFYAAFAAIVMAAVFVASTSFPLQGSPQAVAGEATVRDGPGVTVQPGGAVLHRTPVRYPPGAAERRVEGPVVLQLDLNDQGAVTDARVLSGPEELRKVVLQSVLDWRYESGPRSVQATIDFRVPEGNIPRRIRVGGAVQASRIIEAPEPVYPPEALAARIQGTVRFDADIATDGTVANLTLVSGHPLLVPAAMDAARQYVYQTTLLNGEPAEVVTTIDVTFTLR